MQTRNLGALLLLGAVWGASFLFIKIGVREMPPEVLVALRVGIAALVLLAILYARGLRLPAAPRMWGHFLFTGLVGLVLPYVLITWGEQSIPSGMAAILNATTPLFTLLLAYLWTREEHLTGMRLLGVAIGFVGVVVAVGAEGLSISNASTRGQLAVLVAAAAYGVNGVYSRRAFRGMPPLLPATGQMLSATLIIAPLALALHGLPTALPSAGALGAVLALAVFGTALAYILLYWLIERLGATRSSMVTYLLPPFALVYGTLFLREPIALNALLGLALVVLGILLANGVLGRAAGRRAAVRTIER
ncbi:DMT family transporter [Kouleothrix sp.]|uniref:DMT family transporter n=1 Tax=Kouleothrix sp. TaxID=2779161 RepID=UPI00391ADA22